MPKRRSFRREKRNYTPFAVFVVALGFAMVLYGASLQESLATTSGAIQVIGGDQQAGGLQGGEIQIGGAGGGAAAAAVDQDWREFKRNSRRASQAEYDLPDSVVSLWQFDTGSGKPIEGGPVTSKGKVIFASTDGHVYAVNNTTGSLVWKYPAGALKIGAIKGTPTVTSDGKVFFTSSDGALRVVRESDGVFLWQFPPAPVPVPPGLGELKSSPLLAVGLVMFGTVDTARKQQLFTTDYNGLPKLALAVEYNGLDANGNIVPNIKCGMEAAGAWIIANEIVVPSTCKLSRMDISNGKELENDLLGAANPQADVPTVYTTTPAVDFQNKAIYIGDNSGKLYGFPLNKFIVNRQQKNAWTFTIDQPVDASHAIRSGPAVSKDGMLVLFGADTGKFYAVQTGVGGVQRGVEAWKFETVAPVATSISFSNSTPAPGDAINVTFTIDYPAITKVVLGAAGAPLGREKAMQEVSRGVWKEKYSVPKEEGETTVNIKAYHELGGSVTAWFKVKISSQSAPTGSAVKGPDMPGGTTTPSGDEATGGQQAPAVLKVALEVQPENQKQKVIYTPIRSTPAVDSKNVYFAAENGTIFAIDLDDGGVAWSYTTGSMIRSSPAISYGSLFIGTQNGKVIALSAAPPVLDRTAPAFSNQGQGSDRLGVGGTNTLTVDVSDDTALESATLATDESGAFVKHVNKYGSPKVLGGKTATASFAWSNANIQTGKTIKWKVYAKDKSGNEAVTAEKSFSIVTDLTPPNASGVSQRNSKITVGGSNVLSALWMDDSGMAKAELYVNGAKAETKTLGGKSAWSNFTYTASSAGTVSWKITGTDGSGNSYTTPEKSFTVSGAEADTTPPTVENAAASKSSVEAGDAVTFSADVLDDTGLEKAELEINGKVVDSIDFAGDFSGEARFSYVPVEAGSYNWKIIATDTAGNTKTSGTKTVLALAPAGSKCPLPAPETSAYTECKAEEGESKGTQMRAVYECNVQTGQYTAEIETRECDAIVKPPQEQLPIVYIGVGAVLVVIGGLGLVVWKRKSSMAAAPPAGA